MNKAKELIIKNKILFIAILSVIMIALIIVFSFNLTNKSYAATDGTYGTCAWDIDANGKLTLAPQSGDTSCTLGSVNGFSSIPWYSNRTNVLSIEVAQGVAANVNSKFLFSQLGNVTTINITNLDTSNVTNMNSMFYNCTSLTSLDVTNFDTSNVTDMEFMFYNCNSLTNLFFNKFRCNSFRYK